MLFRRKKQSKSEIVEEAVQASSIEVVDLKANVLQSTAKTKRDIDRLNRLLKANGITLKIHIASGGKHG